MNQQLAQKNKRRGERGSILTMAALSMLSLVLAAGMAIDVSHFYTAKAELQNAADAAALAAASQLNSTSGGIQCAVTQATKALNKYDFKKPLTITSSNVTFAKNLNGTYVDSATAFGAPTDKRFVKVTLSPQPVNNTFSSLVLGNTQNISATATAGLSVGLSMNKFYTAYAFIESTAAPILRTDAGGNDGQVYILDPKNGTDNAPTSYRVLTGPDAEFIVSGQLHEYGYIGSSFSDYTAANLPATSPGPFFTANSMCRYAQIGTNTRFANSAADYTAIHPGANAVDQPPDTITEEGLTYAQYRTKQGNGEVQAANGVLNRRVITLPIVLNTPANYNVSTRRLIANRLAAFFIKKKVGTDCKLHVEYIGKPLAVPVGTYTPGQSPQMGELAIPVLYK